MSPDKASVIASMAMLLKAGHAARTERPFDSDEGYVAEALAMYDEAQRQVRASGPTSKEPECQWGQPTYCGEPTCPKHGDG